jgi:hypothetical protein
VTAAALVPVVATDTAASLAGTMALWTEDLERRELAAKVDLAELHLMGKERAATGIEQDDTAARKRLEDLVAAIATERATLERLRPSSDGRALLTQAMTAMACTSERLRVANGERPRSS